MGEPFCRTICRKELLYSLILMLGMLTFGYVLVYPSPAIPSMEKTMHISDFQKTFFNSLTSLAAIFGPFITGFLLRYFGRKLVTFFIAVLGTIFWLLTFLITEKYFWIGLISRFFLGIVIGGFSQIIPMYIIELSPENATGFFGSLGQLGITIGIVILYIIGNYLDWFKTAIFGALLTLLLSILIIFVPESPAALKNDNTNNVKVSIFKKKYLKPLFISIALNVFQQFSGINAILTNLSTLFSNAGVKIDIGLASAISSFAQVISSLCGGFLVELMGRKVSWVVSLSGISLSLFLYALTYKISMVSWIPIVIVFTFLLFYGLGAGPIPWYIVNEMFESSTRPQASAISSSCNWASAFIVLTIFPLMRKYLTEFYCFIIFMVIMLIGAIFGFIFITNSSSDVNDDECDEMLLEAQFEEKENDSKK